MSTTPLALAETKKKDKWVWRAVGEKTCRGTAARRLVYLREPTEQERQALEAMLHFYPDSKPPYRLEDLLHG
jgi:hypothetical protein